MHALLPSIALGVGFAAVKFFARHGGAISSLNSASTDSRSARRRSRASKRARAAQAAAGRRRTQAMRRHASREARR